MALELGREAWALESALSRLRPLLHPFHVQTHATVSAAFDKYVSMNDIPEAAAACEHLCAFYRAVYSGAVRGAHPMLALQLFTLGDMYAQLAGLGEEAGGSAAAPAGGEPSAAAGSEEAAAAAAPAAAPAAPAYAAWRPSLARQAALQRLFVQRAGELDPSPSACGTVPVHSPFPAPGEAPGQCAARWRARARECHAECAALLTIAYGATHRLTRQAAELAGRG